MLGSSNVIRVASGWATAIVLIVCLAAQGAEGPSAKARQILDAIGVQGGLVVHVGCGDGRLTAALRAEDGFLVHGLDRDAANVEKARATVREAGAYGPVSVERLVSQVRRGQRAAG